jgi:hypothetical protein
MAEESKQHQQLSSERWVEAGNIKSSLLVVGRDRQHQQLSPDCGQRQATSTTFSWVVEGGRQHQQLSPVVCGGRHYQLLSPGWWQEAGTINSFYFVGEQRHATSTALSW